MSPVGQNSATQHGTADLVAAAAVLAVYLAHTVTEPAVIDTPLEHVVYEAVAVAAMLLVASRERIGWIGPPTAPVCARRTLPFLTANRIPQVLMLTGTTIALAIVARGSSERIARLIWMPSSQGRGDEPGCRSYNDPACSGDDITVDLMEVMTASLGEEFAYRFALFAILLRFVSIRVAIVVQSAVWALSHTGFENGYGAPAVVGLFAVGVVYAISVVATNSIWPAVVAHAVHSLGVAAVDHDLDVVLWFVLVVNGFAALTFATALSAALLTSMRGRERARR